MGNDLVTPHPEWGFAGLGRVDRWCICVTRWKQALERGVAPPVDLEANAFIGTGICHSGRTKGARPVGVSRCATREERVLAPRRMNKLHGIPGKKRRAMRSRFV